MPRKNKKPDNLKAKAAALPDAAGIYFFKNAAGEVVYIGKARSLRGRVRTYFLPGPDEKVRHIVAETADIDFILTGSEREAAFLENNYVQQHQPKYNLRLKDDKSFPYLKLTIREDYPGIYFSRRVEKDGSKYFGPFSPASRARTSIRLVNKHFRIRGCREEIRGGRPRPCLEYDLGLCSAPCAGYISAADYKEDAENARLFLEGRTAELLRSLRRKMESAAGARNFEEAARLRDLIRTVEDIRDRPRAISVSLEDRDVVGFARRAGTAAAYLFMMRRGKILTSKKAVLRDAADRPDAEVLEELLRQLYRSGDRPRRLLLPFAPAGAEDLRKTLSGPSGKPSFQVAPGGQARKLLVLASRNARSLLDNLDQDLSPAADLARVLGLPSPPRRIEGFDVSNTGGDESVGSLVVFRDGRPDRGEYRKFKVKTVSGPDDYASLEEVIRRRLVRLVDEKRPLPDLVMVDGGKGQLSAARGVLEELGLGHVPLISLAKREETIFSNEAPEGIRLDRTSPALKLIQEVRDEAHRFAISYHRRRREKKSLVSEFDGIPGLGPKRKTMLLARYGSLRAVREAPFEELAGFVGKTVASRLKAGE